MITRRIFVSICILCMAWAWATAASAQSSTSTKPSKADVVLQTWQMLDYMAADYSGAVRHGKVIDATEYAEMQEFAARAAQRIATLPPTAATPDLKAKATSLQTAIAAKASPAEVAGKAHDVTQALLAAYPVPTAPKTTPDLAQGASLYRAHCAACHGTTGHGDGPAGRALTPPPIDFTDVARADQRSVLSLYETISQGVAGTAMAAWENKLSSRQRWDLAYYVGSLAYTDDVAAGKKIWHDNATARAQIADLGELSQARVSQLSSSLGLDKARSLIGYLRANPDALGNAASGLALARGRLAASLAAYHRGATDDAGRLALSAYLDGVEPVEPRLNIRDGALRSQIELAMGAYRTAVSSGAPTPKVDKLAARADTLLQQAEQSLNGTDSGPVAVFAGAFTILVREGLEALLVVVALLASLRKAERSDGARYVHLGWVVAVAAGVATWVLARYAISISGASRELTEGLSSLFAAAVLLGVGLWMHRKSIGGRWQAYIKAKLSQAMSRRSLWFLFALAFISVYREIFETILFYTALWGEGQQAWLLAGIGSGIVVLGVIAWLLMRTSKRLPIALFFKASSALIAILAVVLAGKGIAALQEAGWIGVSLAPVPHIDVLGIYPSWQPVIAQLLVIAALVGGAVWNVRRRERRVPIAD